MRARCAVILAASILACGATQAAAQGVADSPLLKLSKDDMRKEVDKRYNEALAKTLAPEVAKANSSVFTWASEAKVACGIAIGFLKTSTVDTGSVNKGESCTPCAAACVAPQARTDAARITAHRALIHPSKFSERRRAPP